jgi:hypothetical protein
MLKFYLNTTFSNISAISWRPVLVVEEAEVPGEPVFEIKNKNPASLLWIYGK